MNTVAQLRADPSIVDVSHEERIELVADGASESSQPEPIDDSWRRCLLDFHVDPRSSSVPQLLTERELRISREPLRSFLLQAQEEIDRLYAIVRPQSYVALLCNSDGVAIHHRGDESKDREFKQWGIWLGGVWSERVEGTNGIGTCITDRRPVLVHCAEHFRSRHTRLSCAGAPIFDPHGGLLGVLDVSKVHQQSDDRPFPLLLQTVVVSARAIEERIFREHFQYCWILAAAPSEDLGSSLLLAIDDHQFIIGGDQAARKLFALSDKSLADGIPLSAVFAFDHSLFRRTADRDIPVRLMSASGDGRWWTALLTPPLSRSKVARSSAEAVVHSRARTSTLGSLLLDTAPEPNRGGLSPAVTRRVCAYVEGHLDEKIRLDGLAALAGLSTDHFARAFQQSVGVPPHTYLLRRRLEHVEHMLRETHTPLSEIALATGFSDQSHLARHFRRWAGMSPRQFRSTEGNPIRTICPPWKGANPMEKAGAIRTQPNSITTKGWEARREFSECIMPVMASPGYESEFWNIQLLVDSIPALIHTARPDGYLDYFNKPWLEYLGAALDDVAGWNWTAFIHPEDLDGIVAKWRACLANGETFEYETRVRRADGDYRWMFHRKVPLRDANGYIVKWYGSSLDIEERKTAEEALRVSQVYLAEAQKLSHTGSWANAAIGEPRYWSEECYRVLGFDPAEPLPSLETIFQRIHPDDRAAMREQLDRGIRDKADFEVDMRIVHPITGIRNIRSTGHAVVDRCGDLREMVGTVIDITERKRAEEAIRRSAAYLAEAQRLSHTGSFGWKPDTGEIVWSDETYRIFEYDRSVKPTIDSVAERVHPEDRPGFQKVIEDASGAATQFEHTYRLLLPDGIIKHVNAIAHALQDAPSNREFVGAVTDITERKISEDKVRRLVEAGILGIFFATVQGEIVEANQAFLQLLQYDRQDLVSGRLRWADLTPPEWRERDERSMSEFLATGVFQAYEKEYFRKDGSRVPVLVGGARIQNPNEGVVFVLDLSEQKRAEEKIRRSESYLAEAQRLSQTGSWAWSPDEDIRYWSEECYRVLSFDSQDGLPRFEQFFQRIHPDDQPGFRELIQTAIREKAEWEADYRIVHPGGAIRDIHVLGHPVLSTSGHLVEFVGTVIDVTERKKAEEERRRSEMELRQMLDLAPQQVAVFGPNRERLYANHVALDYLGLNLEEWRKRSDPGEFFHPDDRERVNGHFDRALSSGASFELEVRLRKGDGSYRWFLDRVNPVSDDKGQITRWYAAFTDIEDRKSAEERLQHENVVLREELDKASMFEEIVGTSPALQSVLLRISKVAPSDSTVLITGETGTGKELVARAIHRRSDRASRAFVGVNCAAIPRDLIASELFGHEKGAFTGATQQRLGRFELANGGTIFLDEVGELPVETQIALLRVLQEHEFERVGGSRPIRADVRVIAATNRDLQAAISAGSFRSDLFYRLNVFPIEIPPLRERKEDIRLLVEYFIDRYARKAGKHITTVEKRTLQVLQSYPWPGNIRELQNVIERSVIVCETASFSVDESWLSHQPPERKAERQLYLSEKVAAQEKEIIEAALRECQGRVFGPSGAAAKLGIARSTLESKIQSFKINKNRFRA